MKLRELLMAVVLCFLAATAFSGEGFLPHGGGHGGGGGHYPPPHGGGHYPPPHGGGGHPVPNPNYHSCIAQDVSGGQWTGSGYNQQQAANNALNYCYQYSYQNNTCRVVYCR